MSLTAQDFPAFFEAVWGYAPFPWQRRLAAHVAEHGWPDRLDVPTGGGKTAALDVALFHLALDGGRTAPRRIVLVVDRRVLVDQARQRADHLRHALLHPTHPVVSAVRERLEALSDDPALLHTATLRGGMPREEAWARRPDVPLVAASTVDQIGSRLLFRGYGVSDSMKPVHAGLVGCDTLLLLDEVHLARPFADTLAQLQGLRTRLGTPPTRFGVVEMSATPPEGSVRAEEVTLCVVPEDAADPSNAVLRRRLTACKPAALREVKVTGREEAPKRAALAKAAVVEARRLLEAGHRRVAILVNRVDTARRAFALAAEAGGALALAERHLLTGRMRALEQREVVSRVVERLGAGQPDPEDGGVFLLVTTQCIEAGADLDLDALVTECASLDALRQRAGRVDRRGERPGSEIVVLQRSDLAKPGASDPVYGEALSRTWAWLTARARAEGGLDLGVAALEPHLPTGEDLRPLLARTREAPVILPAWLDLWAQTRPRPHPDPDPSLFLHGIPDPEEPEGGDVQLVWRADVDEDDLDADPGEEAVQAMLTRIGATPPASSESLSVPVWAVRAWLRQEGDAADVTDTDGVRGAEAARGAGGRVALRWGGDGPRIVHGGRGQGGVRAGDVLVVPSTYGGLWAGTWDPGARAPVADLGDLAQLVQRARLTLRTDPRVLGSLGVVGAGAPQGDSEEAAPEAVAAAWVHELTDQIPEDRGLLTRIVEALATTRSLVVDDLGGGWVISRKRPLPPGAWRRLVGLGGETDAPDDAPEVSTESDRSASFLRREVGLTAHLEGVRGWAERFVGALHLPERVAVSLVHAAWLHDVGKADPAFQRWMHGGDPVAVAMAAEPLAKSGRGARDGQDVSRARREARYPRGQRHELVSLAMAEGSAAWRARVEEAGGDWDLVLHLVASHHGWCRPAAPAVVVAPEQDEAVAFELDGVGLTARSAHGRSDLGAGVPDRFWLLMRRYGAHELAWFESILRLADHRRSEAEQREEAR